MDILHFKTRPQPLQLFRRTLYYCIYTPALPTMQFSHWVTSLEVVYRIPCSFLWSHKNIYMTCFTCAADLPQTCKHTLQVCIHCNVIHWCNYPLGTLAGAVSGPVSWHRLGLFMVRLVKRKLVKIFFFVTICAVEPWSVNTVPVLESCLVFK